MSKKFNIRKCKPGENKQLFMQCFSGFFFLRQDMKSNPLNPPYQGG
jgi:hypothetical protein